jgi:hypothetical protein
LGVVSNAGRCYVATIALSVLWKSCVSLTLNPRKHIDLGVRRATPNLSTVTRRGLMIMLFSAIFLQRFALHPGETGIPLCLLVNLGAIVALALFRRLNLDPLRAALVFLFAACVPLSMTFGSSSSSWTSALFALALYGPFALVLRSGDEFFRESTRLYRSFMVICAILGILQFMLQFVISGTWLFTFYNVLPRGLLLEGFNTLQPLQYGSPLYKSNGFLMIEPSTFSQFVAIGLIIEFLFYGSAWRIAVYGAALLLSYSGTGLIILALVPFILISRGAYKPGIILALFAVVAISAPQIWNADVIAQRAATEFDSTNSSAHERFMAPVELIDRFIVSRPSSMLFGYGPGSLRDYALEMPFETSDPPWAKIVFEYGLVGYLLFWPMFLVSVFRGSPSNWLSLTLVIGYLVFGGSFLDPRLQALLLVFCVLPKRGARATSDDTSPPGIISGARLPR